MDSVGAFVGPVLAIALMAVFADLRLVFWLAVIPGVIAIVCVLAGVEDRAAADRKEARAPIRMKDIKRLGATFWLVTGLGLVFTLARFSEAFLVLKADEEGLPLALAPLVLVVMNLVYALGAVPAGIRADRASASSMLAGGLVVLIAADVALAWLPGIAGAFAGIALWGLHMAMTQGVLAKLVADSAPGELRGSAFGVFNLATGLAVLAASTIAGGLWAMLGSDAAFLASAAFAVLAAGVLLAARLNSALV
jgi:MFS family permease